MAPDRRLVDHRQLELARQLAEDSITFLEQQLGLSALKPPSGRTLLRRLSRLRGDLDQLAGVLAALEHQVRSEDQSDTD